jgi:hypothetical protein
MKPSELACRECAAQPNEPCVFQGIKLDFYHADRVIDAFSVTKSNGHSPTDEQWDDAMRGLEI